MDDQKPFLDVSKNRDSLNLSDTIEPSEFRSSWNDFEPVQNRNRNILFYAMCIFVIVDGVYRTLLLIPLTFNSTFDPSFSVIATAATFPLILGVVYAITYISGIRATNLALGSMLAASMGNILLASWMLYYMLQVLPGERVSLRHTQLLDYLLEHDQDPDHIYYFTQDKHTFLILNAYVPYCLAIIYLSVIGLTTLIE